MRYVRDQDGGIVAEDRHEVPESREEGRSRWRAEMELRFVNGEDGDFDYKSVDHDESYDDRIIQERDLEEAWFDTEEPAWIESEKLGKEDKQSSKQLSGQTGIQDF